MAAVVVAEWVAWATWTCNASRYLTIVRNRSPGGKRPGLFLSGYSISIQCSLRRALRVASYFLFQGIALPDQSSQFRIGIDDRQHFLPGLRRTCHCDQISGCHDVAVEKGHRFLCLCLLVVRDPASTLFDARACVLVRLAVHVEVVVLVDVIEEGVETILFLDDVIAHLGKASAVYLDLIEQLGRRLRDGGRADTCTYRCARSGGLCALYRQRHAHARQYRANHPGLFMSTCSVWHTVQASLRPSIHCAKRACKGLLAAVAHAARLPLRRPAAP